MEWFGLPKKLSVEGAEQYGVDTVEAAKGKQSIADTVRAVFYPVLHGSKSYGAAHKSTWALLRKEYNLECFTGKQTDAEKALTRTYNAFYGALKRECDGLAARTFQSKPLIDAVNKADIFIDAEFDGAVSFAVVQANLSALKTRRKKIIEARIEQITSVQGETEAARIDRLVNERLAAMKISA